MGWGYLLVVRLLDYQYQAPPGHLLYSLPLAQLLHHTSLQVGLLYHSKEAHHSKGGVDPLMVVLMDLLNVEGLKAQEVAVGLLRLVDSNR